jgi:hypothetical protein
MLTSNLEKPDQPCILTTGKDIVNTPWPIIEVIVDSGGLEMFVNLLKLFNIGFLTYQAWCRTVKIYLNASNFNMKKT